MNKEILFLVSTICVLMVAASIQAGSSSNSPNLKIDKTIAEILSNETDERIPIIVMFNARSDLNTALEFHNNVSAPFFSDESAIKYKYTLIPGLAAEATAKSIKRLAEDNRVSHIYFDSNTQISASTENSSSDAYSINQTNHPNHNYI